MTPKADAWLERRESSPTLLSLTTPWDGPSGASPETSISRDAWYSKEAPVSTHYWCGLHMTAGSPPGIRLDITRDEVLAFESALRSVFHPFSDSGNLTPLRIRCYALEEVMAEKVTAVLGQRIFAVSRDLYDIFSLLDKADEERVLEGLPKKLDVRGLGLEGIDLSRVQQQVGRPPHLTPTPGTPRCYGTGNRKSHLTREGQAGRSISMGPGRLRAPTSRVSGADSGKSSDFKDTARDRRRMRSTRKERRSDQRRSKTPKTIFSSLVW